MMDGQKALMMSERPAAAESLSLGNYKGVMLCNRPLASGGGAGAGGRAAASNPNPGTDGKPKPFVAGITKERVNPRGYDPDVLERKVNAPERSKPVTALAKHKKWLRDLQKQREELKDQMLMETLEKEERRQKFKDNQKAIRDTIRGVISDAGVVRGRDAIEAAISPRVETSTHSAPVEYASPPRVTYASSSPDATYSSSPPSDHLTSDQRKKLNLKNKPAWAMTESAVAAKENTEAEDLLKFVESLDFENYVDDLEVRAALEAARERISILSERPSYDDEDEYKESTAGRVMALSETALSKHDSRHGSTHKSRKPTEEMSLADSVMSSASSIKMVHSKRSLQAVIDRTKSALPTVDEDAPGLPPPVEPPRIAVLNTTGDAIEDKKKLVSQLGYMNRNPSV